MFTPTHPALRSSRAALPGARSARRALLAACIGAALLVVAGQTTVAAQGSGAALRDTQGPFYATNPAGQVGRSAAITVDGAATDWTPDMIVAQGVANDDPRIFRGSHEGPVYDLYSLSAAWDDSNLYLMWQITNVTDVVDPAQSFPQSGNGKPYAVDIPMSVALDVDPASGTDGILDGEDDGVWGIHSTFSTEQGVDELINFSSKPGVGTPALFTLNPRGAFDYQPEDVHTFEEAGITYAHADGLAVDDLVGIDATGNAGYVPADLLDESLYSNLLDAGHDPQQDTTYEMGIPLASLGLTQAALQETGLGVLLMTTFGESAINSLPQDPAVLDHATEPYGPDPSTSHEKEDGDQFTVPLARIGHA